MPVTNDGYSMNIVPPVAGPAEADRSNVNDDPSVTEEPQTYNSEEPQPSTVESDVAATIEETVAATLGDDESEQEPTETASDEDDESEEEPTETASDEDDESEEEAQGEVKVEHTGGGWWKITHADGSTDKVQGRAAAYEFAGIPDPDEGE